MYLTFVKNALGERRKGKNGPYEELVTQFSTASKPGPTTSLEQLRSWLDALSHVVSQLDKLYSSLVDSVLNLPWSTADELFVKSYIAFVGLLVSARPEYLGNVLERNVKGFTYNSGLKVVENLATNGATSPMKRGTVYDRQHALTFHLLSLIPTLPATIFPVLSKHFPHKREPKHAQVTYIRNLLRISAYCSQISGRIMGLVVERAVLIDVEVQIAYEDLEGANDTDADGIFELDPFDLVVGENPPEEEQPEGEQDEEIDLSDISSEGGPDLDLGKEEVTQESVKHAAIHSMVTKLDAILKLLFQYFERVGFPDLTIPQSRSGTSTPTTPAGEDPVFLSPEARQRLLQGQFLHLLHIFDRTILPTSRTRYTQFLLFYLTSLDASFADLFQGLLLQKALFDADTNAVVRLASVSYVAGFVSRANCVNRDNTRRVVSLLCEYLSRRLDLEEDRTDTRGERFYAIAQGIMIIFCFRWRDLQERDTAEDSSDTEDEESAVGPIRTTGLWMPELSVMQRAVTSPLNPLKYCAKHVVHQFAAVAKHTGFLYCHSIIEANRRAGLLYSSAVWNEGSPTSATPTRTSSVRSLAREEPPEMDSFFPFDPYTLPATEGYIESLYRTWAQAKPEGFDDDDTDSESEDEDEEDEEPTSDPTNKTRFLGSGSLGGVSMVSGSWKSDSAASEVEAAAEQLGRSFGGLSISPVTPYMGPRPQ
ncbi:RNA polymerase I-specific transcription initiation factor RRN3 [Dacryopinax primogenitus]|uniref:RNA polymerase I-specific transcription initiation factor RRN3 n=1 Tax=Dacryopinax primogenitus (strain DJM 731) TaxID=1858805 RepID=M5GCM1_DACPD|nr:RNA polymerase I-specific transcription initiation factor RRN3 [Dacryopinax primogenitus]EJU06295.1 RNA polymerase I-specific transcription initiation factor RRN3 [Dacryopinax primogenitus]